MSGATRSAAVLEGTPLGRLLIFDPTSEFTPLGDLPPDEQGSLALLVAGQQGTLVRLPLLPAESNLSEMEVEAAVDASGSLRGSLNEKTKGSEAVRLRAHMESDSAGLNAVEQWMRAQRRALQVLKTDKQDKTPENAFDLRIDFASEGYAQIMQQRILMLDPSIVLPRDEIRLAPETRETPLVLNARVFRKHVQIKLPPEFEIDELPSGGRLETPYGQFSSTYKVEGSELFVTEELTTQALTVPPEQYPQVRKFFGTVLARQVQPVVLVRR